MAAHAIHEPFYCLLPYLPLALWLARRYATTGRRVYHAGLALAIGAQITLGHFQIQTWTIGLTFLLGAAAVFASRASFGRILGLLVAIAWGLAVASAQLGLTAELGAYTGIQRAEEFLVDYALPPAQLAQPALPSLFFGDSFKPFLEANYWQVRNTSPTEACWYVGTIPLILAVVAWISPQRCRAMRAWKLLVPLCVIMAALPIARPDLFHIVLKIPVIKWFRAAGRLTLISSLGLALLAGSTLDRSISTSRFRVGLGLAGLAGVSAVAWGVYWSRLPEVTSCLSQSLTFSSLAMAVCAWMLGLVLIGLWWHGRVGSVVLFLATSLELAVLFHLAPVRWDWGSRWNPSGSPILQKLKSEPEVGLIAGFQTNNLTTRVGIAPAVPYLGFRLPPPHFILWPHAVLKPKDSVESARWGRRFGVTHGIYGAWTRPAKRTETLLVCEDCFIQRMIYEAWLMLHDATDRRWRVERYPGAFPAVRVLLRSRVVEDWPALFGSLNREDHRDEATYMRGDAPPQTSAPRARQARLLSWNGTEAIVEHDGDCDIIFRRCWYPGWSFQVNGGPEQRVFRADGGLQAVRLQGTGPSRIHFRYRSAWWLVSLPVSLAATTTALYLLFHKRGTRKQAHSSP
ncbi:MAG: hypothetical protein JO161_00770 [Planctomycetaceae bacterium]|nr:hypothetical protein [Planctomycetaceae bacterium]